ncbi:hypothetical protein KAFR_0H02570 [Kazachstania africana CBS 2517]|uniref:GLC7-interacting protein 3 n=1 Tax=Kazachstania africana (strain ATCC 22294 / BCRC 22015 / CBS 2517 / CECT 1963 / NBRC 1671 / NRRL Y-8276) TaxID=1071382 RepID=H2AZB0_KAZAF|nr:hypothetical protein KAFR_0H02570 [Kazachstania africana CBS 2517]CCF59666.1 hypothetical protein KAFR_0H02570 [Kazachstania africana CBS 2517]
MTTTLPVVRKQSDLDVSWDWLYKGKKKRSTSKSKSRGSTINKLDTQTTRKPTRNRSTSVSNAALSQDDDYIVLTPVNSNPIEDSNDKSNGFIITANSNTPKVKRSTSVSNADVSHAKTLRRINSLSNDKPKRSLFSSLFGKKNNTTPPVSRSTSSTSLTSQLSINSKVSNISRTEPASPSLPTPIASPRSESNPLQPLLNADSSHNSSIESLKPISLKRVTFNVFNADPPQQLPSRKPKKGAVLVPEDMISDVPSISQGIAKVDNDDTQLNYSKNSKEYKLALELHRKSLQESDKHQVAAHHAAMRIANEVANYQSSDNTIKHQQQQPLNTDSTSIFNISNLAIDTKIHLHENHFNTEEEPDDELTLDIIYTRCCHLREILPIPATLKQIKGKTSPLQILKFLNSRPTLIDILSFCDFISIISVHTIVFDNVLLSDEMLRIILCSLANSKNLEKLSLRNVVINTENWNLICKFLLINRSITKLDISQTHTKLIGDNESLLRHNLDWDLFIGVLKNRTGKPLEEILFNGIKFNKLPNSFVFQNLINTFIRQVNSSKLQASSIPIRIGLANSDISMENLSYVLNIARSDYCPNFHVQGIDLSFNDLSTYVNLIVNKLSTSNFDKLQYFTLNGTNIETSYDMALLLKYLSRLENLKFLDLSNMPQIFPDILPYLYKYLPRFKNLKRVHLNYNDLQFKQLTVICNILIKCKTVTHVSMLQDLAKSVDNEELQLNNFARNNYWSTLYALTKESTSLVGLDINYEEIPEEIKSRLALCLMRNMHRAMDSTFQLDELASQDDLLFGGNLISETAEDVFKKLCKIDDDSNEAQSTSNVDNNTGLNTKKYLLKKYFDNLQRVHDKTRIQIDLLLEKRSNGELNLMEKENLLRLLLLDKNLSNIFELFIGVPQFTSIIDPKKLKKSQEKKNKHFESTLPTTTVPSEQEHEADTNTTSPHLMVTESGKAIDFITGRPVLFRKSSNTSVNGKKQEEEEGELHKWGFYVQQQRSIYPEHTVKPIPRPNTVPTSTAKLLPKIPSGEELRAAIIKAKGIDSMEDLIQSVSDEQVGLETIYGDSFQNSKVTETYDKLINNLSVSRKRSEEIKTHP